MGNHEAGINNEPQRQIAVASAVLSGFFGLVDALEDSARHSTTESVDGSWFRLNLAIIRRWHQLPLVVSVRATQEWYLIEHVLLEPF